VNSLGHNLEPNAIVDQNEQKHFGIMPLNAHRFYSCKRRLIQSPKPFFNFEVNLSKAINALANFSKVSMTPKWMEAM
jgi:hypothetical protein